MVRFTIRIAGGTGYLTYPPTGLARTTATAELYDPVANAWSSAGTMSTPREFATSTLLPNGQVLIVGGDSGPTNPSPLASAEVYDPVANTWTLASSTTTSRENHTATLLQNGLVSVAGGTYNRQPARNSTIP